MLDNDDSITVTVSAYAIICWPVVNCIIKVFISASNGIICFWYHEAFVWNTGSIRLFSNYTYPILSGATQISKYTIKETLILQEIVFVYAYTNFVNFTAPSL